MKEYVCVHTHTLHAFEDHCMITFNFTTCAKISVTIQFMNILELRRYRPYRLVHKGHKKADVWMTDTCTVNLKGACTAQ